jgi:DNA-binding MarR family transcriptional regulator
MDEDEARLLRTQLKALRRRLRREMVALGDLSETSLQVLAAVARSGDGTTPGELTVELHMTTSNVSAALRTLETAGTVTRRPHPDDGRRVVVEVTDAGRDVVAGARRGADAWLVRAVGAELDDDEQRLLLRAGELMQRLAETR